MTTGLWLTPRLLLPGVALLEAESRPSLQIFEEHPGRHSIMHPVMSSLEARDPADPGPFQRSRPWPAG